MTPSLWLLAAGVAVTFIVGYLLGFVAGHATGRVSVYESTDSIADDYDP